MVYRILTVILAATLVFLLMALLLWYLAFPAGPGLPESAVIPHLQGEASISWSEVSTVQIHAQVQEDALTALGFAHGHARTWQVLLWRQAALGRLSQWFGPDAAEIDILLMRLGVASSSRRALEALPPSDRRLLDAYIAGLEAAFTDAEVGRQGPLVLLDVDIEPWEAFHSLAIERLLAWIASEPPSSSELAPADSALRHLLHIFGFEDNTAIGTDTFVAGRFVTGDSGQPFFLESEIFIPDGRCRLLTVPGTLVFPMGSCDDHSWSRLLTGRAHVVAADSSQRESVRFERIRVRGEERVVRVTRTLQGMPVRIPAVPAGVDGVLLWPGFRSDSDIPVWLKYLQGERPPIGLFLSDGLDVKDGVITVRGNSATTVSFPGGMVVGNAPLEESPALRVREMAEQSAVLGVELLLGDLRSPVAAVEVPRLLSLLSDTLLVPARTNEALTYLRNWNYRYDANEIGASLFEVMSSETEANLETGSDVLMALSRTVRTLEMMLGTDMRSWRWETVQNRVVYFPGWTAGAADGGRPEEVFSERFSPVPLPGAGHPHTMVWGARASNEGLRATSAWEGAFGTGSGAGAGVWFRRSRVRYDDILGRSLAARRPLELQARRETPFTRVTTLSPVD